MKIHFNFTKKVFPPIFMLILTSCLFLLIRGNVEAKIQIDVERTYEMTTDTQMFVTEIHRISNETEDLYVPSEEKYNMQILGFKLNDPRQDDIIKTALESALVSENGIAIQYESEISGTSATINIPYGRDLLPGQERTFVLKYKHPGLIFRNGAIVDGYIHAFSPDFKFGGDNTQFTFQTKLVHSKLLLPRNFVNPEPNEIKEVGEKVEYYFSQDKLIDQYVWLQLGTFQIYDFKITQEIHPTDIVRTGLINRYELILPRDVVGESVSQKAFFESIEPEPVSIYFDDENNLIGVFEFESSEEGMISIDGFARIDKHLDSNIGFNSGEKAEIPSMFVEKYTQPSEYWEVNSTDIQEKAQSINPQESKVFNITEDVYYAVVDLIDYSNVKRFGINERQGALKTLYGGAAVCMEYSDLFLTLMRAKGIPARAVFGYGYDPRIDSSEQEAHQWVQVYMPGLENPWVDVDVTWGENGDTLIGGDLNHFYTHVASQNPDEPPMISRFAYGTGGILNPPKFEIETLAEIPVDLRELSTPDGLSGQYPMIKETELQFLIRQLQRRVVAGWESLRNGLDIQNSSQILVISLIGFGILIITLPIGIVKRIVEHKKLHSLNSLDSKDVKASLEDF